ncbi:hypothetical protein KM176_23715 [Pseudooceanicola sp. CBS1P-1]|uniref:Uncharacterized protein n=1 Tax=Pseudooceanicola albus TaxID=2692189 RepID=A0A6L7GE18_9RHOB|nr:MULTISPECIES: hypothetical protein [Pseudooceanicola]MBT9386871.1 hypothetical protein [Pseudooceanicola endophyticus]MXN20993.1 hypothetical protein [Pseudooceanicola albus]
MNYLQRQMKARGLAHYQRALFDWAESVGACWAILQALDAAGAEPAPNWVAAAFPAEAAELRARAVRRIDRIFQNSLTSLSVSEQKSLAQKNVGEVAFPAVKRWIMPEQRTSRRPSKRSGQT